MPQLSTSQPDPTGNLKNDYENLFAAFVSLRRELEYVLGHLDNDNIIRVGNWVISPNGIYKDGDTDSVSGGMSSADYPFYAGSKYVDRASAPFRVTIAGELIATSATISGSISAVTGAIGGWAISSAAIYKDSGVDATSSGMSSADYPFYAGKQYINRASAPFRVTPAGVLTATSANITGTISSSTITGGTISIGTDNNIFKADSNGIYLGNATFASAPFRVTMAGAVYMTNATVSGATFSGSITSSATITGGTFITGGTNKARITSGGYGGSYELLDSGSGQVFYIAYNSGSTQVIIYDSSGKNALELQVNSGILISSSGGTARYADGSGDTIIATRGWTGAQGYATQTWVTDKGYATQTWVTTNYPGDITAVTAGSGLTGGGTSGDVTLSFSSTKSDYYVKSGINQALRIQWFTNRIEVSKDAGAYNVILFD